MTKVTEVNITVTYFLLLDSHHAISNCKQCFGVVVQSSMKYFEQIFIISCKLGHFTFANMFKNSYVLCSLQKDNFSPNKVLFG